MISDDSLLHRHAQGMLISVRQSESVWQVGNSEGLRPVGADGNQLANEDNRG
jgi:hypothetical protein